MMPDKFVNFKSGIIVLLNEQDTQGFEIWALLFNCELFEHI